MIFSLSSASSTASLEISKLFLQHFPATLHSPTTTQLSSSTFMNRITKPRPYYLIPAYSSTSACQIISQQPHATVTPGVQHDELIETLKTHKFLRSNYANLTVLGFNMQNKGFINSGFSRAYLLSSSSFNYQCNVDTHWYKNLPNHTYPPSPP